MRINLLISIILLAAPNTCFSQDFNGYYKGLERMCYENEKGSIECYDPLNKWFFINHLFFDKDSAFLYQSPVIINNVDTVYSVSDGGFYYYAGKVTHEHEKAIVKFTLTNCDYCGWPIIVDTLTNTYIYAPVKKEFQISNVNDSLVINRVHYKRIMDKVFPQNTRSFLFKIQENKPKKLE
jgi:hypothetical protein